MSVGLFSLNVRSLLTLVRTRVLRAWMTVTFLLLFSGEAAHADAIPEGLVDRCVCVCVCFCLCVSVFLCVRAQ